MDSLDVYRRLPLDPSQQQIRVLQIQPGSEGSALHGRLRRFSLLNVESYEALSYTWGPSNNFETIKLDEDILPITDNLAAALRVLRSTDAIRTIWIDAICIDQRNIVERNQQVQFMRQVYRGAKQVVVWINFRLPSTSRALETLKTLSPSSVKTDLGNFNIWEELRPLFADSYWTRVWIQQEISFASSLVFQFCETQVSSYNLCHLFRLFEDRRTDIDINSAAWVDWAYVDPNFHLPPRFGELDPAASPISGSTFYNQDLDLFSILGKSYKLKCTDERDRLYGLLYLAADFSEGDIVVDYNLPLAQVYINFASFILRKYSSLDFLLYAGILMPEYVKGHSNSLPTWVPDWSRAPNFMSDPGTVSKAPIPIGQNLAPSIDPGTAVLRVFGLRLATSLEITLLPVKMDLYNTPIIKFGSICSSIVEKACTLDSTMTPPYSDQELLPKWHLLAKALLDLDAYYLNDPTKYQKFQDIILGSADRFRAQFMDIQNPADAESISALTISRLISAALPLTSDLGQTWIRMIDNKLIRHTPFINSNGDIGMAPRHSEATDEAWLIFGCTKDLILRPHASHYEVVGEGYLEGWNRGEWGCMVSKDAKEGDVVNGHVVQFIELR